MRVIRVKEKDICYEFWRKVKLMQQCRQFKKDFMIFHVPNEQRGNMLYTLHLKRMGLLPGVPDYCVVMEGGKVAFIEFKRDKKSKLTKAQQNFKDSCLSLDTPYITAYSSNDAINFILKLIV